MASRCPPDRGPRRSAGVIWSERQPEQPPLEVGAARGRLEVVERRLLEGHADTEPDRLGLVDDVVAGDPARPAARAQERAQHPDDGRLTGPVRPQEPVDLARSDRRGRARRRHVRSEAPDQAVGTIAARARVGASAGERSDRISYLIDRAYSSVSSMLVRSATYGNRTTHPGAKAATDPGAPVGRGGPGLRRTGLPRRFSRRGGDGRRLHQGRRLLQLQEQGRPLPGPVQSTLRAGDGGLAGHPGSASEVPSQFRLSDFVALFHDQTHTAAAISVCSTRSSRSTGSEPGRSGAIHQIDDEAVGALAELIADERQHLGAQPLENPIQTARIIEVLFRGIGLLRILQPEVVDESFIEGAISFVARGLGATVDRTDQVGPWETIVRTVRPTGLSHW